MAALKNAIVAEVLVAGGSRFQVKGKCSPSQHVILFEIAVL